MKKWFLLILISLMLVGCSSPNIVADYTDIEAEVALNNVEDLTGKTVEVEVLEVIPDSAFGYNIHAGEHLNFVSKENPKVEVGEKIIVKITKVESMLGSYMISYEK